MGYCADIYNRTKHFKEQKMINQWIIYKKYKIGGSCYLEEITRTEHLSTAVKLVVKYRDELGPRWAIYYARSESEK